MYLREARRNQSAAQPLQVGKMHERWEYRSRSGSKHHQHKHQKKDQQKK